MTAKPSVAASADGRRLQVTFLKSAPSLKHFPPPDQPEVAVAGRSNAGKSSVLNRLTGSRQTAKVSKTPGRTQALNIFDVRGGGRLVDLPGYGYAKAAKAAQAAWQSHVNDYLSNRESLVGLVLVMDIRHPLSKLDTDVLDWAEASGLPVLALLNKADKLKRGQQQRARQQVERALAGHARTTIVIFSAQSGIGSDEVVAILERWLTSEQA